MATVRFERSGAPTVEVSVAGRERLLDVCDVAHAPVSFSCRGATCGTCRVEVLVGALLLESAGPSERATLVALEVGRRHRLACQAIIRDTPGLIRLRCPRTTE